MHVNAIHIHKHHTVFFFRYLPCNSHHIREQEERPQRGQIIIQGTPQIHIQRPQRIQVARVPRYETSYNANRRNSAPQATATAAASLRANTPANNVESSPTNRSLGQSILNEIDLDTPVLIFGSDQVQLQVRDLVNVSPAPSTLNRIRGNLREYILTTLCLRTPITDENIDVVRKINLFERFGCA